MRLSNFYPSFPPYFRLTFPLSSPSTIPTVPQLVGAIDRLIRPVRALIEEFSGQKRGRGPAMGTMIRSIRLMTSGGGSDIRRHRAGHQPHSDYGQMATWRVERGEEGWRGGFRVEERAGLSATLSGAISCSQIMHRWRQTICWRMDILPLFEFYPTSQTRTHMDHKCRKIMHPSFLGNIVKLD